VVVTQTSDGPAGAMRKALESRKGLVARFGGIPFELDLPCARTSGLACSYDTTAAIAATPTTTSASTT